MSDRQKGNAEEEDLKMLSEMGMQNVGAAREAKNELLKKQMESGMRPMRKAGPTGVGPMWKFRPDKK